MLTDTQIFKIIQISRALFSSEKGEILVKEALKQLSERPVLLKKFKKNFPYYKGCPENLLLQLENEKKENLKFLAKYQN
jgi:hypothetical protein